MSAHTPRVQSSTIAGLAYFGLLMALAGLPSSFDPIASVIVVSCGGALALTAAWLLRAGAVVTPLPPIVHGLAYFPGAWAAASGGTMWSSIFVHADSIQDGLLLMTVFTCLTSLTAHALAATRPARRLGRWLEYASAPGGSRPFSLGLFVVFGTFALVAYRSNTISNYLGSGAESTAEQRIGGMQYPSFLGPFFLYCAMHLFEGIRHRPRAHNVELLGWAIASGAGGLLLFVLQSRRVMVGCFLLFLTVVHRRLRREQPQRVARAILPATLLGLAVLLGSFFLSAFWRSSIQLGQAENVAERAGHTLEFAQAGELSTSEIVAGHEQRLQYLSFEGACQQIFEQVELPWSVVGGIERELDVAIPRALNPDKRSGSEVYRCGTALKLLGIGDDVACTATCNGAIIGGTQGVLAAAVLWTLAVALAEAIPATAVGAALIAVPAIVMVQIETGFAPLFSMLRNVVFFVLMLAPFGVLANLARARRSARRLPLKP